MKAVSLLAILSCIALTGYSQHHICADTQFACDDGAIYVLADQEPGFRDGAEGLLALLNEHSNIPKGSRGVLALKFSINCEGRVYGFEILDGIDIPTDEAIINALANLQYWKPAVHRGQPVDFSERMAITVRRGEVRSVEL